MTEASNNFINTLQLLITESKKSNIPRSEIEELIIKTVSKGFDIVYGVKK